MGESGRERFWDSGNFLELGENHSLLQRRHFSVSVLCCSSPHQKTDLEETDISSSHLSPKTVTDWNGQSVAGCFNFVNFPCFVKKKFETFFIPKNLYFIKLLWIFEKVSNLKFRTIMKWRFPIAGREFYTVNLVTNSFLKGGIR